MITSAFNLTATERVLPRMALDFTTEVLDSRVTVTRALNTATRINSSGLIETVNANLPRFDFTLNTGGTCKGLLIEEQRTNLCTYSSAIGGTNWSAFSGGTGVAVTTTLNYALAPDGTMTASRLQCSLGGGTTSADLSYVSHTITGTSCRGSFYVKTNDGSSKTIFMRGAILYSVTVDGTWRRYDFDAGTLLSNQFAIGLRGGQTPTNSNTADILVWGAQIEAGAFATSYIPTTSTSLTRNADVASMTGTNFSDWYNATEGALLVQATAEIPATDANVRFAAAIYDTASYANAFRLERLSGNCRVIKTVSGSSLVVSYSWPIDITGKAIMSYKDSSSASSFRAANPGLYAGGVPSGMAYLGIGGSHVGSNVWCGHVQRVMYWPQRVINAETQSFTN
jgi:hypothetical protein